MELEQVLAARRSTRRFDPGRDIPDEVLRRVLAAPLAMPHAGNTYDWRGVVLRRRHRDPAVWPAVHEALLHQSYVEEAAAVVVWAVQPRWWAARYRANVEELLNRGLIDRGRAGDLLETIETEPDARHLTTGLVGEAMMGVAAAMLVALDAGLGATVTAAGKPGALARALGLPPEAVLCPWGILALGYPAEEPSGPAGDAAAPKPELDGMYFGGRWGDGIDFDGGTDRG